MSTEIKTTKLTPREEDVYNLLLKGFKYDDIAGKLFISRGTVNTHVSNIYMKLLVNDSRELMVNRIKELEDIIATLVIRGHNE